VTGPELTLIVCGAPLAARAAEIAAHLAGSGWRPSLIATPAAMEWLDTAAVERVTGEAPRHTFRTPDQPKRRPAPSATVVCPATFNTVNKAVAGIADNYAMATLCESLGAGLPTVVAPMVNDNLWGHPIWSRSLATLRSAGATLVDVQTGHRDVRPVASGSGAQVTADFDPAWLVTVLPGLC
jgi:phosphopantothenoylcysteine synthetase/decarboxylase